MAKDVLTFLIDNRDSFVSGEYIAKKLDISRQAVSKKINNLKEDGFVIESKTNKGYRLISFPDVIVPEYVVIETDYKPVLHYATIDSTNLQARKYALDGYPEKTLIVSEVQTAGRGRMGREWASPRGGLWFSFILRPRCVPSIAPILNFVVANSVAKATNELYGIGVKMKWPNDIFYEDKKICGIGILVSSDIDLMHYVVVGIGINVNNDTPDGATSLKSIIGKPIDRNVLLSRVLNRFKDEYTLFEKSNFSDIMDYSRSISNTIGKKVRVSFLGVEKIGTVLDIDQKGALILEDEDGSVSEILAGDVDFLRHL
ncbi:MAG: biotin--[acetyl-CoA-carboxylase] ligase [Candidatus Methanofastidiosa archaeon]|nr:biotin--[acetyl-CoA-carboxylase] ligase [Candidatus Methanofastidiosa archaeon]